MKHCSRPPELDDLLRPRLVDMIDPRHELVKFTALIDWEVFEREWAGFFPSATGHTSRLVAGLLYLQHAYRLSDEAIVARWVENPYYQHFTGETFFQHRLPIDPSLLTRWRKRIGEEGVEWLLTQTIEAGRKSGAIDESSVKRVADDTTVMEKTIAYPTGARLYERARAHLVVLAQDAGVDLRQTYARLAPRLALQVGRYAHAKQFRRKRKALKRFKGYAGRVMRDLRRHLDDIPVRSSRDRIAGKLALVSRLLHQTPKVSDKIYALHEPEVDRISKGKARVHYEFGCKVSIAATLDEGIHRHAQLPRQPLRRPHSGSDAGAVRDPDRPAPRPRRRGPWLSRPRRRKDPRADQRHTTRLTPKLIADPRRRSAIEAEIGHKKTGGRLSRSTLKGTIGDALFAVLCGCGHNIRKILAYLRTLLALIIAAVLSALRTTEPTTIPAETA